MADVELDPITQIDYSLDGELNNNFGLNLLIIQWTILDTALD